MQQALTLAARAAEIDEVPVGAVLVQDGLIIGRGFNQPVSLHDATAHAEIQALRDASQNLANYRLPGTTLYVTIEPCTMCYGAIVHARVQRLVFGATEPKYGAVVSGQQLAQSGRFNHQPQISAGILSGECGQMMRDFFAQRRQQTRQSTGKI